MNENKKHMFDMIENYFYYCEDNGYTEFEMWCEDNIENEEQESLFYEMMDHVNTIAGLLFLGK